MRKGDFMVDQIRSILPQSVMASKGGFGTQTRPIQPLVGGPLEKAAVSLSQKYGSQSLDPTVFTGARDKYLNGKSLLPEGALGLENAVDGKKGANLNFFA